MEKRLGVEVEFTGVSRKEVVTALENLFETEAVSFKCIKNNSAYTAHKVKDKQNNIWVIARDRSISAQAYAYKLCDGHPQNRFTVVDLASTCDDYKLELVSPVLTSETLPTLFTIIDVLKGLGALVNDSCGIHVHIDAPKDIESVVRLYKEFCIEQNKIFEYFNVHEERLNNYCMPYDIENEVTDVYDINDFLAWLWETQRDPSIDPYTSIANSRSLRYHAVNFYSIIEHGTIEFRLFNSSLNKYEIAEMLDWVLHFVYTYEDCNGYLLFLSNILMRKMEEERQHYWF